MSQPTKPFTGLRGTRNPWSEMQAQIDERMRNHPNNGTLGWWRVEGIRHGALVRASSAPESIQKAADCVDPSWETPEAFWIAVELPEVIAI